MFVKINESYIISFTVVSKTGNKITNDTPYCIIQDIETKQYYNGLFFEDEEIRLQMTYAADGVYTYSFIPEKAATYKIFLKSDDYDVSKTFELSAYNNDSIPSYKWRIDNCYQIIVPKSEDDKEYVCKIQRESDSLYWNGSDWQADSFSIPMKVVQDLWIYEFTPDASGMYIITTSSENGDNIYGLEVSDNAAEDESPVLVSSSSLRFSDGTNTVCMSNKEEKLYGVAISAYNKRTKELAGKTTSSRDGSWSLILPHGTYIFTFTKKNYSSVSFERSV